MKEVTLSIHLVPGSRKTQLVGLSADGIFKIKVTAPALEGRANLALLKYLSEMLNIPVSALYIKHGEKSHQKVIGIQALTEAEIQQRLNNHIFLKND